MGYFISAPTETGWRIDPQQFIDGLTTRWPGAKIHSVKNPAKARYSHEWTIHIDGFALEGMLDQQESAVYLDGEVKACAIFAIWFRTCVPQREPLIFYDENFETRISLDERTTQADIEAAFS